MRNRLLAALGIAAALLSTSACQSSPEVAAYVGGTPITEQTVTELLDGYNKTVPENRRIGRTIVVQYLVQEQLCNRLREQKGFTIPEQQVPNETPEFVVRAARTEACISAIPLGEPKDASDAELRDLFDRATAAALLPAGTSFDTVREAWRKDPELLNLLAREKAITHAAIDVKVNPRYGGLPIVGINPAVAARIGDRTGGVVLDRPATAPPPQQ